LIDYGKRNICITSVDIEQLRYDELFFFFAIVLARAGCSM